MLRDLVRNISTGIEGINFKGMNIGLVDERGEISALYKGVPQNDIGVRTDVLENIPKPLGIKMLIRSMAPEVIVADEIGTKQDVEAIKEAVCSGVKGIFTAHGQTKDELMKNPTLKELMKENIIEKIIFLRVDEKGRRLEETIC